MSIKIRINTFVILSFIIFFSFVSTVFGNAINFSDVKQNNSHYEGIDWLVQKGINGYEDGTFGVDNPLLRQHAAIMFTRAMSLDQSGRVSDYFVDVDTKHPYASSIAAVGHAGIFKGSNGRFGARNVLTREQMATTLVNAFELNSKNKKVKMNLKNVDISHKKSVQILADLGITNQTKDFRPKQSVTRGQFATFLKRANDIDAKGSDLGSFSNKELRRIEQINNKWALLKPTYSGSITDSNPAVTPPYRLGKLSDRALREALDVTNFVRYVSYLPSDVTLNGDFNKKAQAAAVLNAANQKMDHYPIRPNKMDESLYKLGYDGAGASNLGYGYHTLANSIKDGYMPDDDDLNREKIGHRRWVLSPRLHEVGFGYATATDGTPYTAMKVIAPKMWDNKEAKYQHISWPAETVFPVEFFGKRDPWSVSLNPSSYDASKTRDISVTLTRVNDGKVWKFNREGTSKDGFFAINTENYGYAPFTIIFQPNQTKSYEAQEHYKVEINGLYTKTGNKTKFQFDTTFFKLD